MTLKQIVAMVADLIVLRAKKGKNFGVILIPEGLIEFIPEIKGLIRELNSKLADGQNEVVERLAADSRATFLSLPNQSRSNYFLIETLMEIFRSHISLRNNFCLNW